MAVTIPLTAASYDSRTAFAIALAVAGGMLLQSNPADAQMIPVTPPAATAPVRASERDSVRAHEKAYATIRASFHRTGTAAFRRKLRERVPGAIEDALRIIPGDEWLNSVRLFYPVPASSAASPMGLHDKCGASPWWCSLLYMFALHKSALFSRADSVLDTAMVRMSPEAACVWNDVSPLITDREARSRYERMQCADREQINEKLWWLADPLHSVAGNERRLEHYAREVNMRLAIEAPFPNPRVTPGFPWGLSRLRHSTRLFTGTDIAEENALILAEGGGQVPSEIGPEVFVRRAFRVAKAAHFSGIYFESYDEAMRYRAISSGHRNPPSARMHLVPLYAAVDAPFRAEAGDWTLEAGDAHELAFTLAGRIATLDHQHAMFLRGDSALLVLLSDASSHAVARASPLDAVLVLSKSASEMTFIRQFRGAPRYLFMPTLSRDSLLASFELVAPAGGAARVRFGAAPPETNGRVSISDIALFDVAGSDFTTVTSVETLLPRMLVTTTVPAGSTVGLFWELYGLSADERPLITARVTARAPRHPDRRALRAIAGRSELSVTWTDQPARGMEIEGRQQAINLGALEPGSYMLEVSVSVSGQPAVVRSRPFEIR